MSLPSGIRPILEPGLAVVGGAAAGCPSTRPLGGRRAVAHRVEQRAVAVPDAHAARCRGHSRGERLVGRNRAGVPRAAEQVVRSGREDRSGGQRAQHCVARAGRGSVDDPVAARVDRLRSGVDQLDELVGGRAGDPGHDLVDAHGRRRAAARHGADDRRLVPRAVVDRDRSGAARDRARQSRKLVERRQAAPGHSLGAALTLRARRPRSPHRALRTGRSLRAALALSSGRPRRPLCAGGAVGAGRACRAGWTLQAAHVPGEPVFVRAAGAARGDHAQAPVRIRCARRDHLARGVAAASHGRDGRSCDREDDEYENENETTRAHVGSLGRGRCRPRDIAAGARPPACVTLSAQMPHRLLTARRPEWTHAARADRRCPYRRDRGGGDRGGAPGSPSPHSRWTTTSPTARRS